MPARRPPAAIAAAVALWAAMGAPASAATEVGANCHRLYGATSEDGYAFKRTEVMALDVASAPDAVLDAAGGISLYYVNGSYADHGIWRAKEGEPGTFKPEGNVLLDGEYNQDAVTPDVVRLPDGRWRLYFHESYITRPSRLEGSLMRPIYTALSEDGVNFKIERKVFDVRRGSDPSVVRLDDGTFVMALAQVQDFKILLGISADGATFTLNNRLDGGIPELMKLDGGKIRLLHHNGRGFASYLSEDAGKTWQAEPGLRMEAKGEAIGDPTAVRLKDGSWRLFYRVPAPGCMTNHVNYLKGGTAGGNAVVTPRHILDDFSWEGFKAMPPELEACMAKQIKPDGMAELKKGVEPWEKTLRQKAQAVFKFCTRAKK